MRKLTRKSLEELAQRMPVLSENVLSSFIGGGDGTQMNPYTMWEYISYKEVFEYGWVDLPEQGTVFLEENSLSYFGPFGYQNDGSSGYWGGSGYDGSSGYDGGSGSVGDPYIGYNPSCVFSAFAHLDSVHDEHFYHKETLKNLGYRPNADGGVNTSDIPIIGSYGGLQVQELNPKSESDVGFALTSNGTLIDGSHLIMTFNAGIDHAVVVTGVKEEDGVIMILYYDPINKQNGFRYDGDYVSMYSVKK